MKLNFILAMVIITFLFWPQNSGNSQQPVIEVPDHKLERENRALAEKLKSDIIKAANNNDTIAALIKPDDTRKQMGSTRIIIKTVVKEIPIIKIDTVYKDKIVFMRIYLSPPGYGGDTFKPQQTTDPGLWYKIFPKHKNRER